MSALGSIPLTSLTTLVVVAVLAILSLLAGRSEERRVGKKRRDWLRVESIK